MYTYIYREIDCYIHIHTQKEIERQKGSDIRKTELMGGSYLYTIFLLLKSP